MNCCTIIFLLVAATIIPQWRTPKSKQEPPAISFAVLLSLTLVFVVVFLLDLTCTLLCARWERFTQVIFFWLHIVQKVVSCTCRGDLENSCESFHMLVH